MCPVCRTVTKIKRGVEKDLAPNYALVPIIEAHKKLLTSQKPSATGGATSSASSSQPPYATIPPQQATSSTNADTIVQTTYVPIISQEHLSGRIEQVSHAKTHLVNALASLPSVVAIQATQINAQFEALKLAIIEKQQAALAELAALQVSVATHLTQELANSDIYIAYLRSLLAQYPQSIQQHDVAIWNEDHLRWTTVLGSMSQNGLIGAFVADIPATIPSPTLSYEASSINFSELWHLGRDATATLATRPAQQKPLHIFTQSASSIIRRYDVRNKVTVSEINHPGVRSWSAYDGGRKLVAASGKIKVYDTLTGECLSTFDAPASPTKRIIAGGQDLKARAISFHVNQGTVALWDLSQGGAKLAIDMDVSTWNTTLVLPLSRGSHLLLVPLTSYPFDVLVFNMVTASIEEKRIEGFYAVVVDIATLAKGNLIVTLCSGGVCSVYSADFKCLKTISFDPKYNRIAVYLPPESKAKMNKHVTPLPFIGAFGTMGGSFAVYDPNLDKIISITHMGSTLLSSSMRTLSVFGAGKWALSGHSNGKIHAWELATSRCATQYPASIAGQFNLCDNGRFILVGTPTGSLNCLETDTLSMISLLPSVVDGSSIQAFKV